MTDTHTATTMGHTTGSTPTSFQGALLDRFRAQAAGQDLWVFGYASLLWRPEFEAQEQHRSRVWGWHRALKMWSRLNRGSPECPGLVFALLPGGSCQGVAYRVARDQADEVLVRLWPPLPPRPLRLQRTPLQRQPQPTPLLPSDGHWP